jgi:hypothetical protein
MSEPVLKVLPPISENPVKPADYDLRYSRDGGVWYRKIVKGEWMRINYTLAGAFLMTRWGFTTEIEKKGECSPVEYALQDVLDYYEVDFVGKYAGYLQAGDYVLPDGSRMLITKNVQLIEPKQGEFSWLLNFLGEAFPAENQLEAFMGWLQWAIRTLRNDQPRPGHPACWANRRAAIIVGDPGHGKTALQRDIINPLLTGRFADPSFYLTDKTTFTGQLAEAEHWLMSDPGWSEPKERQSFLHKFKQIVANSDMTAHPKGKQAVDLPTYRLLTISLNRDKATLEDILPLMPASTMEKSLWLDFESPGQWAPNGEGGLPYGKWKRTIQAELPAFLWWLLNEYEIPLDLQHPRYGINYTHPKFTVEFAAKTMRETDQEAQEVVFDFLARPDAPVNRSCTAAKLLGEMQKFDSKVRERAKYGEFASPKKFLGALRRWVEAGGKCDGFLISKTDYPSKTIFTFLCEKCDVSDFQKPNGETPNSPKNFCKSQTRIGEKPAKI